MQVQIKLNKVHQYRHYSTAALRKAFLSESNEPLFLVHADGSAHIYWMEQDKIRSKKYASFRAIA